MTFNIENFVENIKDDFEKTNYIVEQIGSYLWDKAYHEHIQPHREDEYQFNLERLEEHLHQIKLKLLFAYESQNLMRMIQQLDIDIDKFDKLTEINHVYFAEIFHSPVLWTMEMHLNTISSGLQSTPFNIHQISILEQILRGTAKMLSDRSLVPGNEKEVQDEIYKMLIHVFPDTVREIPISKVSKIYKPDVGVKSLKAAIEYKFVDSKEEMKKSIGGIFEDIHGYEGSLDWTTYYAVFYVTDNFMTIDQIKAEFKLSSVPHNWEPIVVFGKGARKNKK